MVCTSWSEVAVATLVVVAVVGTGCAKRPMTTSAAAPAPAAEAGTTPRAGTTMRSVGAAPVAPVAPGAPGDSRSSPSVPVARPLVKEFTAAADLVDIYFEFDRYEIRPGDVRVLESNARWLRSNRDLVLIEGHCDERGTNAYNVALGERRAKAAMNYLVSQGVAASRISIVSYGEERPQCTERTDACWQKNRRAHFLVKSQ
jgi:peptidoglycan-associated lipoprotein